MLDIILVFLFATNYFVFLVYFFYIELMVSSKKKGGRPKLFPFHRRPLLNLSQGQALRLNKALLKRKLKITELVSLSGIKKSTILRILNPQPFQVGAFSTTLFALALALEINPGWLTFGNKYSPMLLKKNENEEIE